MDSRGNAGQVDQAIEAAQRALAADEGSAQHWHDLGVLYQLRGALADSRVAFERAAAINPSFASVHNNLGNTFLRLGETERAIVSFRRALALEPNLMPAHANVASALHVLGRNAEALVHARRAVELDPDAPGPRITAAFVEGAVSGYGAALDQLDALLARLPDNPTALAARAYCLLRLERFTEALEAAQRGLALQPNFASLVESLGCALRGLSRFDEAFAAFDRAIELGAERSSILVLKAGGLLEIGRMDEAERTLEAALEAAPDCANAWSVLVDLRSFAPDAATLATMERYLATSPNLRASEARAHMHFALGKAYRRSRDPRSAFRHFAAGNALKRSSIVYDIADDERIARATIERFTPATMHRLAGSGDASRAPIFVIGMPRSGTSLVEQILASHPDVFGAGELTLFDRALAEAGSEDMTALGSRYLELVDEIAPADKRVVDKLPSNFRHVALLHLALPRARIVHCVRDALDTCFSCYTTLFTGRQDFSWDLVETGRFYRNYATLMDHWRAVMPAGIMLDVSYEDIVADLETTARRILAFCDLPWDERVLRFYQTERPIRTASYKQARQPIYATSVRAADAYRDELAPLIAALAEEARP
jgi:tetratricopeptide (TPR) repeat protein